MSHYTHITIEEREKIYLFSNTGVSITEIAKMTGRSKSTISRELRRNTFNGSYSPAKAQTAYDIRRMKCRPYRKIIADYSVFQRIVDHLVNDKWSPEQIANRMRLEKHPYTISCSTIYRAVNDGYFSTEKELAHPRSRGGRKYLRHKGKPRKKNADNRGRFPESNPIDNRPREANERIRKGDWEGDTILGSRKSKACITTYVDRMCRFLRAAKAEKKDVESVNQATIKCLKGQPLETITTDRGIEFRGHKEITDKLEVEFYFPPPRQPWQRGTNENTNGLLREFFPKGMNFNEITDDEIQAAVDSLNLRPRKCLGYRTPYEVFYDVVLHLV